MEKDLGIVQSAKELAVDLRRLHQHVITAMAAAPAGLARQMRGGWIVLAIAARHLPWRIRGSGVRAVRGLVSAVRTIAVLPLLTTGDATQDYLPME